MIVRWIRAFLALVVATAVVTLLLDMLLFPKELFLTNIPLVLVFYVLGVSLILYFSRWIDEKGNRENKTYYEVNNEAFRLGLYLGVLSGGTHMLNSPQADPVVLVRNLILYGLAGYFFGKAMKGKTPEKKTGGGKKQKGQFRKGSKR